MNVNSIWENLIAIARVGLFGLPIIIFVIGLYVIASRIAKKIQKDQAEFVDRLRRDGVSAPAILHSAHVSGRTVRYMAGPRLTDVMVDVEVQPEGQASFRVTTQFSKMHIRQAFQLAQVGSRSNDNRTIWVVYNPANPSEMIFDYFDIDREEVQKSRGAQKRFDEFADRQPVFQAIHKTGIEALATVLDAKELGERVASESATPMRFLFRVQPDNGAPFEAETEAFVTDESRRIYTVGRRVYVKYDPKTPSLAVLVRPA